MPPVWPSIRAALATPALLIAIPAGGSPVETPRALYARAAQLANDRARLPEARELAAAAVQADPALADAHYLLGWLDEQSGRLDEAVS